MDKLVKCSKCGSDAYIDKIYQGESRFKVYYTYGVKCENPECDNETELSYETEEQAIAVWNDTNR